MKGVVLAGGKGSRLRPFTYSGAKQLVPIANTPVLHFPVRQLVEAGIHDIAIVVGDTEPQIREAMGDGSSFGARFTYVPQAAPLGIAHAALICREFIGANRFVLYLGDNVLQRGIRDFAADFADSPHDAALVLKQVADPRAFGVAEMDGERLVRVVEKPADPPTDLAVIGVYAFSPAVFGVIERQQPSARGELEIADAINGLLAAGRSVSTQVTREYWIDTGKMEDMLAANRVILDSLPPAISPRASVEAASIEGIAVIDDGARVAGSKIIGPVAIGAGARVHNCVIGPHVSIGRGALIEDSWIVESIVMDQSEIRECPGIESSMIGRFTRVIGAPAGARLTLGDHSRLEARG